MIKRNSHIKKKPKNSLVMINFFFMSAENLLSIAKLRISSLTPLPA
jgi:hypothetical protein